VRLPGIKVPMLNWISHQWFFYWWPSDKGNAPEAIQQAAIEAIVAAFLIPAFRRFLLHHFDEARAESKLLHEKLDHIIRHHPDIPPFKENDERPDTTA
jgi:hypothetical protein